MNNKRTIYEKAVDLMQDPAIRSREFYSEFHRLWTETFRLALASETKYFPEDSDDIITVPCTGFPELGLEFHLSQRKIFDWYQKETSARKKIVFEAKRFSRNLKGQIFYDKVPCTYDPQLPEPALTERMRNIVACAFPGHVPDLRIVYGNKWVNEKFNVFLQRRLTLYLIQTDYVPAFLVDPFEVCMYLFLMDYCIIKEDSPKVKDAALRTLLHIFRPSPMLMIKGLINNIK